MRRTFPGTLPPFIRELAWIRRHDTCARLHRGARIKLLGEKLIAFRDSERPGTMYWRVTQLLMPIWGMFCARQPGRVPHAVVDSAGRLQHDEVGRPLESGAADDGRGAGTLYGGRSGRIPARAERPLLP